MSSSVGVRWRPLLATGVVTHLVTRFLGGFELGHLVANYRRVPVRGRTVQLSACVGGCHDCRRPQVLLYLAAVRDGPSPNGLVCPVWLTVIAITTNNVTMPAMITTRTIHAPTPNSDGYGGGWAIASSYRRLHTWQVASLGLNSGMSR